MSKEQFSAECLQLAGRLVENLTLKAASRDGSSNEVTQGLAATVLKFLAAFESISLPDSESGTADSIRFYLRNNADRFPYGSTVRFDELYQKLGSLIKDSALRTRTLLLLLSISRQRAHESARIRSSQINIVTHSMDTQRTTSNEVISQIVNLSYRFTDAGKPPIRDEECDDWTGI